MSTKGYEFGWCCHLIIMENKSNGWLILHYWLCNDFCHCEVVLRGSCVIGTSLMGFPSFIGGENGPSPLQDLQWAAGLWEAGGEGGQADLRTSSPHLRTCRIYEVGGPGKVQNLGAPRLTRGVLTTWLLRAYESDKPKQLHPPRLWPSLCREIPVHLPEGFCPPGTATLSALVFLHH